MNKYIVNILKQCRVATIPDVIEVEERVVIPKTESVHFDVGGCYSIIIDHDKLVDYDVEINCNLNELNIEVLDLNERFIKVFSPVWEGWLPKTCIQITKKL